MASTTQMLFVSSMLEDVKGIIFLHDYPLEVSLNISNASVHHILIDGVVVVTSSSNILYLSTLYKSCMKTVTYQVKDFTRALVILKGII